MKLQIFQESLRELRRDQGTGHTGGWLPERTEVQLQKFQLRNKLIDDVANKFFDEFDTLTALVESELAGTLGFRFERKRAKLFCACNGMPPADIGLEVMGRSLFFIAKLPFPSMSKATLLVHDLVEPTAIFYVNRPIDGLLPAVDEPIKVMSDRVVSFLEAIFGYTRMLSEE